MAFTLKNIIGADLEFLRNKLERALSSSRFSATIKSYNTKLTIHDVRLKQSKDYCGNHPFSCPVRQFERPHKKYNYLEGADWVVFNDLINDILDLHGISANVASSLVVIRKGRKRCIKYWGHKLGNGIDSQWDKEGKYEDYVGKKVGRSEFPEGTPGIPTLT